MFIPGLVVFEKSTHWEAILRRHFAADERPIRACRTPEDVNIAWRSLPGNLTLIDFDVGGERALNVITQARLETPPTTVMALIANHELELEWPARELGACAVLPKSIAPQTVCDLCEKYFRRIPFE